MDNNKINMKIKIKGTKSKYHGVKIKITWDHKGVWKGIFYFTLDSIGKTPAQNIYVLKNYDETSSWFELHSEQDIDNTIERKDWTIFDE